MGDDPSVLVHVKRSATHVLRKLFICVVGCQRVRRCSYKVVELLPEVDEFDKVGSKSCIAAGCWSTGVSPSSAPSLWVIMQGRRAFLFGSFPTADGRCRTGCRTPPRWFFAVSVFVSTGAATAPRWETIHGKLKNDRGSNRPVPD